MVRSRGSLGGDRMKKILIATPTFDGWVHARYMMSITTAIARGATLLDCHMWVGDMVRMRNRCIRIACESDATDLMFWDADISMTPTLYDALTNSPHPFAAGLYMNARAKYPYHGTPEFNADGWAQVDRVPAGAMVISIEALRKASSQVDSYVDVMPNDARVTTPDLCDNIYDADDTRLSEDYSFCTRMARAGYHPHIYGRETACHWKMVPLHQTA